MLTESFIARLKVGLSAFLALCVAVFIAHSLHWPLINDASLGHYTTFLIDHGFVPYRDLGDTNMPGSYLPDWLAVHTIGGSALAWRLFDLGLMGAASAAILVIAWPYDWFAGVFGAALLILFHGRDGMGQLGQRDMIIAVLLLIGYAFLFHAVRNNRTWAVGLFGLCVGMATTIKPTALPIFVVLLAMAAYALHRRGLAWVAKVAAGITGFILPVALAGIWLVHMQAVAPFWESLREINPYYAGLGRKSMLYLLRTCLSPSLQLLALVAAAIAWKRRDWRTWEGSALITGVLFGVAGYVIQGKGYAYHRYPLVALDALWVGIEFASALREQGTIRAVGLAGLVCGSLVLAPLYVRTAVRAEWSEALIHSLQADLTALGGSKLSGQVQCIDWVSGCGTTLYRMQLVQSTGLTMDFLVFGPDDKAFVREARARFWQAIHTNPPRVIVVTSWLHARNVDHYGKLSLWPDFANYLTTHYDLYDERSFLPVMTGPQGYRVYVLKHAYGAER